MVILGVFAPHVPASHNGATINERKNSQVRASEKYAWKGEPKARKLKYVACKSSENPIYKTKYVTFL